MDDWLPTRHIRRRRKSAGTFQQNNIKLDLLKWRHRMQNLIMAGTKSELGGLQSEYKINILPE